MTMRDREGQEALSGSSSSGFASGSGVTCASTRVPSCLITIAPIAAKLGIGPIVWTGVAGLAPPDLPRGGARAGRACA